VLEPAAKDGCATRLAMLHVVGVSSSPVPVQLAGVKSISEKVLTPGWIFKES
jgi:hypothetical protein